MMRVPGAYVAAMAEAEGSFRGAAATLARRMELDDALRAEAATLLIALLIEPGHTVHAETFGRDTGMSVEAFVAKHLPTEEEARDR